MKMVDDSIKVRVKVFWKGVAQPLETEPDLVGTFRLDATTTEYSRPQVSDPRPSGSAPGGWGCNPDSDRRRIHRRRGERARYIVMVADSP